MTYKTSVAVLALAAGAAAITVPVVVSAHDRGGMRGAMMGGMMMDGMMMGGGFDFAELDADGDGKISRAELDAHRAASVEGLDADKDGLISKEEATAFMTTRMQAHVARMVDQRFAAHDLDGDGKIGAAEMLAPPAHTRLFERADADGDGAVSEAEIAEMREMMAEMRGGRKGMRGHGGHGGYDHMMGNWFGMDDDADDAE